jgi:hypothetical protein
MSIRINCWSRKDKVFNCLAIVEFRLGLGLGLGLGLDVLFPNSISVDSQYLQTQDPAKDTFSRGGAP